jgi:16S rRNA (guanine966-N2)-methyltransferase
MRITGGQARGIPLVLPKGDHVRPATDALRQAVFSSLASRVPEARFLDLFAGSGAYGLEALSRGAAGGVFVERDERTAACLRRNVAAVCKSLGRDGHDLRVVTADATAYVGSDGAPPSLVFIDPPWDRIEALAPTLFARLGPLLAAVADPVIVFEMPGETTVEAEGWTCVRRLGKGARQPGACFYRRA